MPGIAGIIAKTSGKVFEKRLGIMLDCMIHEKFYTSGKYVNDSIGFYVGWVCREGSFSDCMPQWNENNDLCLFFSGEDFQDKEFIENLKSLGHSFNALNASYLIHMYEEAGYKFYEQLNGRFNGIILDLKYNKIILFNDRYGLERIYYHETKDAFYFASEAKSLLKVIPELREIEYRSLGELFSCGCVLENRTLFKNVYLLPCGSNWSFEDRRVLRKNNYYNIADWENQPLLDIDTYVKRLRKTFGRILPRYFRSREPIGMSLTGGLDTRMIMSHLDLVSGQLPCYTFGGMYRDCSDVKIARKVADTCTQPHQVIPVDRKFFSEFPKLAERSVYISDGSFDVTGASDLYINRLAREIAPVRMTGNYGSEVLRSIRAFKPNPPNENLFSNDFKNLVQKAESTYGEISSGHPLTFNLTKQAPWHHYGRLVLEQSQLTLRSPFLDNDLVGVVYQAPPEAMIGPDISLRLINAGSSSLGRIRTDRGIGGNSNYLFSMGDRYLQEFTFKAEYAYDYGMPQWVASLDHIFKPFHLERLFLGRHKFCHFRIWYRNELSDYVKEIIFDTRTSNRPYINKNFLREMANRHVKGDRNYTTEIHKTLTVELIHRLFIDQ